jgi:DNA-binding transcriptional LysR family regulator
MNINSKDLNLLYIFQILMEERSVSKAAKRVALTQPAVSNALIRLRRDFNDPLLVRSTKGMTPTPLALSLWPKVNELCAQAAEVFSSESFVPKDQINTFRFATTDYFEWVFLGTVLNFLQDSAPHVSLVMRPTLGSLPVSDLESGQIDFAAGGFFGELPEGFHSVDIFNENYCCIVRRDHPKVGQHIDLETFVQLEHILVTLQGDLHGVVDRVLAKKKLKRKKLKRPFQKIIKTRI